MEREGRTAAMGIWLIHSAHFVNFKMKGSKEGKEHERSKSRNERRMSDLGGQKHRKQLMSQPMSRPGHPTHKQFIIFVLYFYFSLCCFRELIRS